MKASVNSDVSARQLGLKNPKVLISLLIALLTVAIAGIIWFSNTNATGALSQVNFPKVSIAEGSKFYLNGNKSLTAIKDEKLLADNTNGTAVEASQINSELTSFANSQYGNDPGKSYLTNPNLLSLKKLNSALQHIPATDNDYWLSDTDNKSSLSWQQYATKTNSVADNKSLKATGKDTSGDGSEYDNSEVVKGNVAWNKNISLADFELKKGAGWSLNNSGYYELSAYETSEYWHGAGDTVYNNIYLRSSGTDAYGNQYKATKFYDAGDLLTNYRSLYRIVGYVKEGKIVQAYPGDRIPKGTICCSVISPLFGRLEDSTGFEPVNTMLFSYCTFFAPTFRDVTVVIGSSKPDQPIGGGYPVKGMFSDYLDEDKHVIGQSIRSGKYAIRPEYICDVNKIAYLKENTYTSVTTSATLGNMPITNAVNKQNYKAVVKSSSTTIASNISAEKLSTDRTGGAGNRPSVEYNNATIKVPYGSTRLTLSNCFTTTNATHISALAENSGDKKYGVLAQSSSSDITLDITGLLANTQIGSNCTVSFYAEKVNGENISDEISDKAVTVKIEVVEGPEQTITYDNGGGIGTLPAVAKVKAGINYNLANGAELTKDNNPFSCWKVKYTDFTGEEEARFIKSSEAFVVPDTIDGNITATALYSGFSANKTTQSTSSVYTVTWNANLPDGVSVTSWASASQLSDDMTKNYQKVKLKGSTVSLSSVPTINTSTWVFDGWYDAKTGGNKLTGQTPAVNANVTYYAHWQNGFTVTFDLNAPSGETCTWGNTTSPNTLTSLAKPTAYVIENPSGVTGNPICTSDATYVFAGWYDSATGGNQVTVGTSTVTRNKTIYVHWAKDVFLAKVDGTDFDPTDLSTYASAGITNIADVKAAATSIASGGTNPDATKYNAINDQYHLFARIGGTATSTTANDWLECRIIHVGQHDSDGSGLTFQTIHAWQTRYGWKNEGYIYQDSAPNWSECDLRTSLNSTIYNTLPDLLKTNIMQTTKKSNATAGSDPNGGSTVTTYDNLFILSYTEFVKDGDKKSPYWTDGTHDGSVYDFWSNKDLLCNSASSLASGQQQLLYKLNCDRSGTVVWENSWLRSVDPNEWRQVLTFHSNGMIRSQNGYNWSYEHCVAPAFAF